MSLTSKVSENFNCITDAYIWRNQRKEGNKHIWQISAPHLFPLHVNEACIALPVMFLCAPLLSPCIVGVDHLPAHQGVFRSVSESPYWIMDDARMKGYLL